MHLNELQNLQDDFALVCDTLLDSTEGKFNANANSFKSFCSNEIISRILEKISSLSFDGIEYFNNKINFDLENTNLKDPKNHEEFLKISYDILWNDELNSSHIYTYASLALHAGTTSINELISIGAEDLFKPLIDYINSELNKLIRKETPSMSTNQTNHFHIQSAPNSIIGTQETATINNSYSMEELKSLINENVDNQADKEQLDKLINTLELLTQNNVPLSKGALQKFSDTLVKHSWLTAPLGTAIVNWLTNI